MLSLELSTSNLKSRRTLFLSYLKLNEKNEYYSSNSDSASRDFNSCTFARVLNCRYRNNHCFATATYYRRLEVLDATLNVCHNKLSSLCRASSYTSIASNNRISSL